MYALEALEQALAVGRRDTAAGIVEHQAQVGPERVHLQLDAPAGV